MNESHYRRLCTLLILEFTQSNNPRLDAAGLMFAAKLEVTSITPSLRQCAKYLGVSRTAVWKYKRKWESLLSEFLPLKDIQDDDD